MRFYFYAKSQPFFEGEGAGGGAGVPAPLATPVIPETPITPPPTPEPLTPSQQLSQIWDKGNTPPAEVPPVAPAPAQPVEPVQVPAIETPIPEKILGKYENQGEFIKAFQSLQGTYTKDHQALLEANKVIEAGKTAKADLEARLQTLSQPPAVQESIDDFDTLGAEAYTQKFYEDPKSFTKDIEDRAFARAEKAFNERIAGIESKLNPVVETIETQQHVQAWDDAASELTKKVAQEAVQNGQPAPNIGEFVEGMKQYIRENNLSGNKNPAKVLSDALTHARGLNYKPQQVIDPKSYLQDEKFMQDNIYSNPAIKEKFIKDHMTEVRGQQTQLPNSITGQSNNGSPAMPPVSLKGKPMRDVHDAAAAMMFGAK